jgi:hypothetical protein
MRRGGLRKKDRHLGENKDEVIRMKYEIFQTSGFSLHNSNFTVINPYLG